MHGIPKILTRIAQEDFDRPIFSTFFVMLTVKLKSHKKSANNTRQSGAGTDSTSSFIYYQTKSSLMGNGLRHKLKELRSSDTPGQEIDNIEGIYWSRKSLADIEKLAEAINDTCIRRSIAIVAPQGGGKSVLLKVPM